MEVDRLKDIENDEKYYNGFNSYKLNKTLYSDTRRISYSCLLYTSDAADE